MIYSKTAQIWNTINCYWYVCDVLTYGLSINLAYGKELTIYWIQPRELGSWQLTTLWEISIWVNSSTLWIDPALSMRSRCFTIHPFDFGRTMRPAITLLERMNLVVLLRVLMNGKKMVHSSCYSHTYVLFNWLSHNKITRVSEFNEESGAILWH